MQYRSANRELLWRCWDDEWVVYDPDSGGTHLLNVVATDAFQMVEQTVVGTDELAGVLAANYGVPLNPAFMEQIETLLVELEALGLIEAMQP